MIVCCWKRLWLPPFYLLASIFCNYKFCAAATSFHQALFVHFYDSILDAPVHLCSIESASRLLHQEDVRVFTTSIASFHQFWPVQLSRISISSIDVAETFSATPLWRWFATGQHQQSSMVTQNLSNALRLALIWKHGGMYMDLDIIATSHLFFTAHGNLARQASLSNSTHEFNNAVLNFPREHPFVWRLMEQFVLGFDGYVWGENGPALVTRAYNGCLAERDPACTDLEVSASWRHSPIPFSEIPAVLQQNWMQTDLWDNVRQTSWATHWYNSMFAYTNTTCIQRNSVFEKIMVDCCPVIRRMFGDRIFCTSGH